MRAQNLPGTLTSIAASLALFCVLRPAVADGQTKSQPTATDMNVVIASIRGISVGMTPRRVLLETQKHNWTYGRSSTDTLDDIIAKNPSLTSVYLDLNEQSTSDFPILLTNNIAVHFAWDNGSAKQLRVVMIAHTYDIPLSRQAAVVEAAKAQLNALGGFKEEVTEGPQFENRLTYQKVDRSYIMYQFVRLSKDSSSVMVHYTVCRY